MSESITCFLYILKCADTSYYTGITNDINRRLFEHNHRVKSCLQKSKIPVKLVYLKIFKSRKDAAKKEKEIKGWCRIKKENIINKR